MPPPYRELPACGPLARWMECAWQVEAVEPIAGYAVRPDGCLDLVYSREDGLRVVGAMTTEQRYDLAAGARTVGVRLRPGMAGTILGTAPEQLTDRVLAAGALWGRTARELESRLGNAGAPEDWIDILLAGLRQPEAPNAVQRAIEAMAEARGVVDLEWVACQANLSPRQFRRRCTEESGLPPKHLCRVLRFRHACELAAGISRVEWAAVAAEAGYFDQAHLIRDFREFAGTTPMSVFSNRAERSSSSMST